MSKLPVPQKGQLLLLIADKTYLRKAIPPLIAHLTLAAPLRILDGSNSFNFHTTARELRRKTINLQENLDKIFVARAFTCYQVVALLLETPYDGIATLGLDLLSTFYDESVPEYERKRLFDKVLMLLHNLSQTAPVALTAYPRTDNKTDEWLTQLEESASQIWKLENKPTINTPRLF